MSRKVDWTTFKSFVAARGLSMQWLDTGKTYWIKAFDSNFSLETELDKDPSDTADLNDFVSNYRDTTANQPLSQTDSDYAQIVRIKAAKKGWSFWSVPIEIVTSTIGASLFCESAAGVAIPWITAKIYDSNNVEITTPGVLNANLANCVKTVVDFEPTFNYEIIGGSLRINSNPSQDVRLWIIAAPDIPAQFGGSKEFASGVNLKFLSADNSWDVDGRVAKSVIYDPVTHQGKIRMIVKHPAGLQVNLMFVAQLFRQ